MAKRKVVVSRRGIGADPSIPRPLRPVDPPVPETTKQSAPQAHQSSQLPEPAISAISIVPKKVEDVVVAPQIITPYLPTQAEQYHSPYASSKPTPAQPTNATLAAISEKVNKILAPVHALGLKQINNLSPSPSRADGPVPEQDIVSMAPLPRPEIISPAIKPNAARTGGRRGRGPRRRGSPIASGLIKVEEGTSESFTTPTSSRARGTGRGSRPRGGRGGRGSARGGKRKREDVREGGNETDSSEEVTSLPTQSRSGRKIFQAAHGTPVIKIDDDGPTEPHKVIKTATNRGSSKRRASSIRTPGGASAVCKNCGRGHSPMSNAIVFCDDCNKPWHMFCHDPPIKPEIVRIAEKEWFCSDCTVMREERLKLEGRVAGGSMTLLEKRKYLKGLPQDDLVSLLVRACALHPDLPIFAPKPPLASTNTILAASMEELIEDDYVLPYPKAGNGIRLRPESEDMAILLDDDTTTFSHTWKRVGDIIRSTGKAPFGVRGKALAVGAC